MYAEIRIGSEKIANRVICVSYSEKFGHSDIPLQDIRQAMVERRHLGEALLVYELVFILYY